MPQLCQGSNVSKKLSHSKLFENVTKQKNLKTAWFRVRKNAKKSLSKQTQAESDQFETEWEKNIRRIQKHIRANQFDFSGSKGISIEKNKKNKSRPVVIAPIKIRILQRGFLNILSKEKSIKKYMDVKTSFGAVEGKEKGVPGLVKMVVNSVNSGMNYYIKSDIKDFFTKINLTQVLKKISEDTQAEQDFTSLLEKTTRLELDNLDKIKKSNRHFFDFNNRGTPQGCSLSPLIANIYLYDFDCEMNSSDVHCYRYLDDILILAKSEKIANKYFIKANAILRNLDLQLHDNNERDKSKKGHTHSKFEFTGIEFTLKNNMVRPTKRNINNIKTALQTLLAQNVIKTDGSRNEEEGNIALINTLDISSKKIRAWGNTFLRSCGTYSDNSLFGAINKELNEMVINYLNQSVKNINTLNAESWKDAAITLGLPIFLDQKK